jgi:putative ABC transport system permease protein
MRPSSVLVGSAVARTELGGKAGPTRIYLRAAPDEVGGVANVMVVSVLERQSEIGLRRALGATRAVFGALVLIESTLLSC